MPSRSHHLRPLTLLLLGVAACAGDLKTAPDTPPPFGRAIYGLSTTNDLVVFGSLAPDSLSRQLAVKGLPVGEALVGLDFGPRDRLLYAVGLSGAIYTIDTLTAAAAQVGNAPFLPALVGGAYGVDFNPVPNRIRVHSDLDQNLRLNQITGSVAAVDTTLVYEAGDPNQSANPALVGTAYTVTLGDTTQTMLFAIDANQDVLVRLASPNSGRLTTVGPLGLGTTNDVGFDIGASPPGTLGVAYATVTPGPGQRSQLVTLSLTSGAARLVGTVGFPRPLRGIAIAP